MTMNSPSKRTWTVRGGLELATLSAKPASSKGVERFLQPEQGDHVVDHAPFDALLAKFAERTEDGIVRVNYRAWTRVAADRVALRRYIDSLAALDPLALSLDEQFAYWANLYNALVLNLVLQAIPITSIRRIRTATASHGPWKQPVVQVGAIGLSLDDIEHAILRRRWRDPRVHYALSCASIGGANLPLRAWRGVGLSAALDKAGRAYVNHPRGVRFEGDSPVFSSIYRWYAADFGGAGRPVLGHLASMAEPPLRARLLATRRRRRHAYDWSVNAMPTK